MTDHDPLCPWNGLSITFDGSPLGCMCSSIAQVRTDERERIAAGIDAMNRERYSVEGFWMKRVSDALDAAARIARSGGVGGGGDESSS